MENDPRNRRPSSPKGAPKGWFLTKAEAQRLLDEERWEIDPEQNDTYAWTAYRSDRNELLLFMPRGRSVLYESRDAVIARGKEIDARPRSSHVLEGLLPQGPKFVEAIPSLIEELAHILKIPREALDLSFDSLDLVEQALNKIRPRKKILEVPNLFAAIIAYTGEVVRKATNGRWDLNPVHGGIWEPYVWMNDREYMCPFMEPYRDIAEKKRGGVMLKPLVAAALAVRPRG